MQGKTFTARESEVLKTIDTIIKVCNEHSVLLPFVPKFEEKFQALKTKRSEVAAFSIDKHQAKSNQSAIVSDVDTEKGTLATYVSEKIGAFMEFAKETNDAKLSNMIPNMLLTKLKSQKPLDMVTNVLSFVETANKLDFTVAEQYGIKKSWLQNVADKTHTYNNLLPQQNATKQFMIITPTYCELQQSACQQFWAVLMQLRICLMTICIIKTMNLLTE